MNPRLWLTVLTCRRLQASQLRLDWNRRCAGLSRRPLQATLLLPLPLKQQQLLFSASKAQALQAVPLQPPPALQAVPPPALQAVPPRAKRAVSQQAL